MNLPWPHRSPSTRFQLLDTMAKASLDLGNPTLWAFYIGRHPMRALENILFLALSPSVKQWLNQVGSLREQQNAEEYLRRCAEIVGGTGQSYSRMIEDVLEVHDTLEEKMILHQRLLTRPAYMNLSDPELRRAINGHLPDDSQLWLKDEIVNMEPEMFAEFDTSFLRTTVVRDRFKLFLGAFVVWLLSPMTSSYLTSSLFENMGKIHLANAHITKRCLEYLDIVMPLVVWKAMSEPLPSHLLPYQTLRVIRESLVHYGRLYGEYQGTVMSQSAEHISVNAFNQTMTWEFLDSIYNHVAVGISGDFFSMLRHATRTSVVFLEQSLKRPKHNEVHMPGLANIKVYRMLVSRELVVGTYYLTTPLTRLDHPWEVLAGVLGAYMARNMLTLFDLLLHDERFQVIAPHLVTK